MANKIQFNENFPKLDESMKLYERATGLIPSYSQTLAKGPAQHVFGVMPIFCESAKGAYLTDVDGNEYLDMQMAIGPLSLGYQDEVVDAAIQKQLGKGISFSLTHRLELEVSELLREVIPNAESVRISKTGADVTSAAVRVARAFTKRDNVLCCGYHGWHDWYIGVTDRNGGVPKAVQDLVHTFQYNDLDHLKASMSSDTACVILEPMAFAEPNPGYLQAVKDLCDANGTLLIFDEMWTGFRWAVGGAQEYYGVKPHLATYSKAMANGMPISALTGRADIMKHFDQDVFWYTTFGGETLSLAATMATIQEVRSRKVPEYLQNLGTKLMTDFDKMMQELDMPFVKLIGNPARSMVTFTHDTVNGLVLKSYVQQELGKRGILWGGFHNLSYAHKQKDMDYLLSAYKDVFQNVRSHIANESLETAVKGKMLTPVFRKTTNFNTKPRG